MNAARRPPRHRARAAQSDRRRRRRQCRESARARARPRPGRAPISSSSPSCSSPAIRPKTSCSSRRSRPPAARRSRRSRARRPTRARPCWSARPGSRTASSTTRYLLLEGGKIAAARYKVDLPNYGVFDEKRVFAPGPMPGPIVLKRRAHRRSGLRGHLGRRTSSSAWPRPAARSCWCRTARPIGATRRRCGSTSRSRAWSRAGCRSSISTRSAGRTNWCSTAPRSG